MCGIAGGFGARAGALPDRGAIERMSCAVRHRGPDGAGYWESPDRRAALAHRRLSVIDLATGQQPMVDETGEIALVFNGEIYNYRELRAELEREGVTFRTQSDTEVLLRLYDRRGVACLDDLRGMFAFALWDARRDRFVLARDRLGKKPLYFTEHDGALYFASSLGALRAGVGTGDRIDLAALDSFMTLGYVPAPRTIFEGVRKLEAATVLTFERGERTLRTYWDLAVGDEPFAGTREDALDHVEDVVATAVALRLRSDVPLGVFLSGGIDSSLVTAVAVRQSQHPVRTFSIAFDDAAFDEGAHAARVADHLGTVHEAFRVQPDVLGLLPRYVRHFGEPFADASAFPTWVLAEATRRHVTVALGGDGGDEGFAGYDWYRTAARLRRLGQLIPAPAAAAGGRAMTRLAVAGRTGTRRVGQIGRGLAMIAGGDDAARFAALRTFVSARDADALYAGTLADRRRAAGAADVARLRTLYERCEGTPLRRMRYVDIKTYLADCLMPKVDVATMAHGLEARAPLLDHELIRFALRLPDEWLVDKARGKTLLRDLLARHLPRTLVDREKQGFTPPLRVWFAGPLRDAVAQLARSDALQDLGWFSAKGIGDLVSEHAAGHRDNSQRLFQLLVLDGWLRAQ